MGLSDGCARIGIVSFLGESHISDVEVCLPGIKDYLSCSEHI